MKKINKTLIATKFNFLRKVVLAVVKLFPYDIKIRNPYSKKLFLINFYRHKSYWYYGSKREENMTRSLDKLLFKGNKVIEVGAHIGFLTHLYSKLVGPQGRVIVFEPGENNLLYIRFNLKPLNNVKLLEKACTDFSGTTKFYIDGLTGQNNSLLSDHEQVEAVARSHFECIKRTQTSVECVRLCDFIESQSFIPDHVKIDCEGAEISVLRGMGRFLGLIPSLMVEIRQNHQEVYKLMKDSGYVAKDDQLNYIQTKVTKGKVDIFFQLERPVK